MVMGVLMIWLHFVALGIGVVMEQRWREGITPPD